MKKTGMKKRILDKAISIVCVALILWVGISTVEIGTKNKTRIVGDPKAYSSINFYEIVFSLGGDTID